MPAKKKTTTQARPKPEPKPACPLCGRKTLRALTPEEFAHLVNPMVSHAILFLQDSTDPEDYDTLVCRSCGWFHLHGELKQAYSSGVYRAAARMLGVG